jgi:hypothetical protein
MRRTARPAAKDEESIPKGIVDEAMFGPADTIDFQPSA